MIQRYEEHKDEIWECSFDQSHRALTITHPDDYKPSGAYKYTVNQVDSETAEISISPILTILVSTEDVSRVIEHRWYYNGNILGERRPYKPFWRLSAFILDITPQSLPKVNIKHINENKLDFRRNNLLPVPVRRSTVAYRPNPLRIASKGMYELMELHMTWLDDFVHLNTSTPFDAEDVRHQLHLIKNSFYFKTTEKTNRE
jgi:hypothetical protein